MNYRDASHLYHGDEVTLKRTGEVLTVLEIQVEGRNIYIQCSNGCVYQHQEVR